MSKEERQHNRKVIEAMHSLYVEAYEENRFDKIMERVKESTLIYLESMQVLDKLAIIDVHGNGVTMFSGEDYQYLSVLESCKSKGNLDAFMHWAIIDAYMRSLNLRKAEDLYGRKAAQDSSNYNHDSGPYREDSKDP